MGKNFGDFGLLRWLCANFRRMAGCQLAKQPLGHCDWSLFRELLCRLQRVGRTASKRGINPWTGLLYTFGLAGICLLILNLLPVKIITGTAATPLDFFWLGTAWQGWLVLFLLGAIPTVLGFGLLNVSLTLLPSSTVSLIVTSEPVFTTITAFFLLKENMDVYEIIGGALIIAGVICLRVYESRSKPKPE